MIPIGNLYYLLCYAWNRLDERDFVDVEALPRQDLPNLLGRILTSGVKRLLRQGIDRIYIAERVVSQSPRGKIDVSASIKEGLLVRNAVSCVVDELNRDAIHNQIIKTTLRQLSMASEIDRTLAHELRTLWRQLNDISFIRLRPEHFSRVQLHRNIRFLLHVCELCFYALLADDHEGSYRFRDFVRDEDRMRKVFQDFVYNFYRIEQNEYSVSSERMRWATTYADVEARELLPEMITDVCLASATRKIVIECKFSPNVLQENWGKLSARSDHLYQLFAYIKNFEYRGGVNVHCDGLLLYPTATEAVDFLFEIQGHRMRVATIDLREHWSDIKAHLLEFISPWKIGAGSVGTGAGRRV
jgi:5-methylcytosine-specific restriction enzyme subunit McrC